MGLFDKETQERIQEGKRQIRRAVNTAREQGSDVCHSCVTKTATTTQNGDPLCSDCTE